MTVETGLGFHAAEIDTTMVASERQVSGRWISRDGAAAASGEFRLVVRSKERDR
jgi:hypothetical protein